MLCDARTKETVWRDYACIPAQPCSDWLQSLKVSLTLPEVDISIPIPSPRGIIACTLKDAQSMSIRDMEHELAGCGRCTSYLFIEHCGKLIETTWGKQRVQCRLTDRAARDELCVDDLSSSTFGIVDAGIAGGMLGTGIMSAPEACEIRWAC